MKTDQLSQDIPILRYHGTNAPPPTPPSPDSHRKTYPNRSNIDWSYEYELDSSANLQFQSLINVPIWKKIVHRNSAMILLLVVGLIVGPVAIFIDVVSRNLNDVKYGLCVKDNHYSPFVSKVQCGQDDWQSWSVLVFRFVQDHDSMFHYVNNYLIFIVVSCTMAYLTTLLVKRQPYTKYSGISELKMILSGFVLNRFLTVAIVVCKSIGLVLIIGSGIWVGKEGPMVHIAACIAEIVSQWFPRIRCNEALKREVITASTLAGISVAFNAPIGGVLFCLEQMHTYFPVDRLMWNSFVCATVAVMMLQLVHPFADLIYAQIFHVTNDSQNWLKYEIVPFMVLGVAGGYFGILFNKLNFKFAEVRSDMINKSGKAKILEVLALTLVTAVISYPFVITRIPLTELISVLFSDCRNRLDSNNSAILSSLCYDTSHFPWSVIFLLLTLSIQGFALALYSYGMFIPGGVLMPALSIGAIMGRFLGTLVEYLQFKFPEFFLFQSCSLNSYNCITPGSYAVVGAASFLTSVTKMSVSVVIILFELTGALNYVIPIMIGVLLSKFISDLGSDKSCYELWLQLQNYPYLRSGLDEELIKPLLAVTKCRQFLKPTGEIVCIYDDEIANVDVLKHLVQNYEFEGFPVLDNRENKILIGWCSRYELLGFIENFDSYEEAMSFKEGGVLNKLLSNSDYVIISPNLSILTLYAFFDKLSLKLLIFLTPGRELRFNGLMTKKDLIEIVELKDQDLVGQRQSTTIFDQDSTTTTTNNNNVGHNGTTFPEIDEFIIED